METLAERIARDGPVNELDAIGWAIRLAKRLEALHQLGVAHGSVSPACILTAGQDRNARAYLADVQHTTPTPAYQSPERILGGDISMADDVWALASTLYALLTGQSPFAGGSDAEVRQKILAAAPPPLAVFDVGDDDLQHILDRAFARELGGRTSNITAFRRALEEWHPDRGVTNLPPLEDEDSTNDDEDVAHTLMVRDTSAYLQQKLNLQVPNQPPPGAPAPIPKVNQVDDDDDDDNVRTVMRSMPQDDLASMIAKATAGGAPGPAQPPGPAFPRPGAAAAPPPRGFPAPAAPPPRGVPAPQPPFGRPGSSPGMPAVSPYGATPQPPQAAPAPPPYAFGGRPAPAPAPAPAQPLPNAAADDDDDDEDNARTMMRSPEQYLSGLDAPAPAAPPAQAPYAGPRPGPLGPPGARATALGGFQGSPSAPGAPPAPVAPPAPAAPPPRGFPPQGGGPLGQQPAPFPQPYDAGGPRPPQGTEPSLLGPSPNAWGPTNNEGPAPAATMALPAYDGPGPGFPEPRLGGGTQPMGGPPEPRLGGGTQPMGGPAMEAAMAALAAQKQSGLMPAPGLGVTGLGAPGMGGPGMGGPGMGAPVPGGLGATGLGAPGMGMGGPGGGMPVPGGVGGMAAPGDLSALEAPVPGAQMPGMPGGPMPGGAMMPAPEQGKSSKGLLIVAAIVALLIAAGVTFVILRFRAG
ncbi:MAG: hypothetical protein QM820_27820 [Minicystis sp.]